MIKDKTLKEKIKEFLKLAIGLISYSIIIVYVYACLIIGTIIIAELTFG